MMNILFLIGNGFDLNLGMNTRYADFYEYYNKYIKSSSPKVLTLKNEISENLQNWSDLELALGQYSSNWGSLDDFDDST
ncbi:AbiH family protein [Algoriphagus persicinus]|uniref:AbiH family protein n=1 Tax=Algoriphagus persicinus TaxID=3108754 RepID=UPI002B396E3C|nr:AbiH family protein [Algoriphagus sp. E1-3-M2]MEB2787271.1 AbiH family protein [Algoriphagus sp. E1-3-M2]